MLQVKSGLDSGVLHYTESALGAILGTYNIERYLAVVLPCEVPACSEVLIWVIPTTACGCSVDSTMSSRGVLEVALRSNHYSAIAVAKIIPIQVNVPPWGNSVTDVGKIIISKQCAKLTARSPCRLNEPLVLVTMREPCKREGIDPQAHQDPVLGRTVSTDLDDCHRENSQPSLPSHKTVTSTYAW